ncbi:hypothetical protein SH139x_002877 [Planctomycetaceae bacterium SH139]
MKNSTHLSMLRKRNLSEERKFKPSKPQRRRLLIESLEGRRLLAATNPWPLASLDGTNGFRIDGVAANDFSGGSVSSGGDVNGDGFDDLLVGARFADPNGNASGSSYVVFGKSGGFAATLNLSTLDGTNGFRLDGVAAGDQSGHSVSSGGDVNGDGFDDLIIGASGADPNGSASGSSYVVLGKSGGFAAALNLSTLDGTNGFRLDGVTANDQTGGWSASSGGDVNGDGFDDLIVGGVLADPNGSNSGASYVVLGKSGGFSAMLNLSTLDGTNGFRFDGVAANDRSGGSVSSAGDVNGDGFDDLIVGAIGADPNGSDSGSSYVVLGKSGGFAAAINLSSLDGSNGFRLDGVAADDNSGVSVSSGGDVNGDGFDDLIIGASGADPIGSGSGSGYVVLGKSGGFAPTLNLSTLDGISGFRLDGVAADDNSGVSVSSGGDVNGDGFDDLIVGANEADPNGSDSGSSYVVLGKSGGFAAAINLSTLDGTSGFRLDGVAADDQSGRSVSSGGDVNGDGFDDLIVGAPFADPNGSGSGSSYVVFGGNFTGGVETQVGGDGDDTLTADQGADAIDILIGGHGNDILLSDGGDDVLIGGEGDDVLAITEGDFSGTRRLVGGNGFDTLRLDAADLTLDLTAIADNRLLGIEQIDITGSGDNTLTLDQAEVLSLSDESNTLLVRRNSGDTVDIGSGWTQGDDETIDGDSFDVYTQGAAVLKVQVAGGNLAPTNILLSANLVLENAITLANAVPIGTMTAVDPDAGDTHSFALFSGVGPNDNSFFSITGDELAIKADTLVDFETKPNYIVHVQATDSEGNTFAKDLLVTVGNRGELETVTIGDGTSQRSMLSELTVTFDSEVTLATDSFTVVKRGADGGAVDVAFNSTLDGQGRTVATLTFSGSFTQAGSLVDGNYQLQIDGSKITDAHGNLDLDEDGSDGGSYLLGDAAADDFFRLFGDVDGNRSVGFTDFLPFRASFGTGVGDENFDDRFDVNQDDTIGFQDFLAFRSRFGSTSPFE